MGKHPKKNGGPSHNENRGRSSTFISEDDDSPIFFYMPKEKYGEFCQWHPTKFSVTKDEISRLVGRSDLYTPGSSSSSSSDPSTSQLLQPLQPNNPIITDSAEGENTKGKGNTVTPAVGEDDNRETEGGLERETEEQYDWGSIVFNCAEQFMMYCKAARFGDLATQKKILLSKDPKEQKRLGKATAGFEDASWDQVKYHVVVAGNMAKFGQNKALIKVLMNTMCKNTGDRNGPNGSLPKWKGKELVEAASRDRIWGIGFTANNALKTSRENWGQNLLGKALMEVRQRLMEGAPEAALQKEV